MLTDENIPDTVSQSFTSLSLSDPSKLGIYRSHAVLKTWIENWLSIPVCSYFYMPQPLWGQLIYGTTMLSRWASLTSIKNKIRTTSTTQDEHSILTQPLEQEPDPSPEPPNLDLQKPHTRVTLKAQILTQPELQIDVLGVLEAMALRLESATKEITAAQGGVWINVLWERAAKRLKMKRTKFEKWSEIVTIVGGEGILLKKYQPLDDYERDSEGGAGTGPVGPTADQVGVGSLPQAES